MCSDRVSTRGVLYGISRSPIQGRTLVTASHPSTFELSGSNNPTHSVDRAWDELSRRALERFAPASLLALRETAFKDSASIHTTRWTPTPLESTRQLDPNTLRLLCDWGWSGRTTLHREFAEYVTVWGYDDRGQRRPKRVEVTTELCDRWALMAELDPEFLLESALEVLRRPVSWAELYGPEVRAPWQLSPAERRARFLWHTAGDNERGLTPETPEGHLNREHALFLVHPRNRTEDLVWLLALGARPWKFVDESERTPALADISDALGLAQILDRKVDSALVGEALTFARQGHRVCPRGPLGVHIHRFARTAFSLANDDPVPDSWVRYERGGQRLVFGPTDESPHFLDDIFCQRANSRHAVRGGCDVLDAIEVGVELLVTPPEEIPDAVRAASVINPRTTTRRTDPEGDLNTRGILLLKARYDYAHTPIARERRVSG